MKRAYAFLTLLLIGVPCVVQAQCRISGTVRDAETNAPLAFAHIYIKDIDAGTTSDGKGRYTMPVPCGTYNLRASYMGYTSSVRNAAIADTAARLDFSLKPVAIDFPEITVVPGENPAIPIIKKAIAAKRKVEERLENYSVEAHTKARITNLAVEAAGLGKSTYRDGGLAHVVETHSTVYWSRKGGVKEVVHARKEGGFGNEAESLVLGLILMRNFSADKITIQGKQITGPISEEGLDDYWYELKGTTVYDGKKVYVIDVHPESSLAPRMDGRIYIADSSYLLLHVSTGFTDVVFGPSFANIRIRQQFTNVDGFWMPNDIALTGAISVALAVLATADVELLSVLKDYRMNMEDIDKHFGEVIVEIVDSADNVDEAAWAQRSFISTTTEEVQRYEVTDSLRIIRREEAKEYTVGSGLGGKELKFGETTYDLPGVFSIYRFNKVEGHALNMDFRVGKPWDIVESISAGAGYGFSDERWKWALGTELALHQSSSMALRLAAFDKLSYIDEESYVLGTFPGLVAQAAFMYDPRDFYYQKGFEAALGGYPLRALHAELGGAYNTYYSATTNTDEHLFRVNRAWPDNPTVNDGSIASASLRLTYGYQMILLNKGNIERLGSTAYFPVLEAQTNMAEIGGETWTFNILSARYNRSVALDTWGRLSLRLAGDYADNRLPTQRLLNLTGSTEGVTGPWLFRSALPREFGGDARVTAMAHWELGNLPFRALGIPNIPYINTLFWEFSLFGNAGWTDMRDATAALQTVPTVAARTPFYEMGFSVGNIFSMLRFDFAWRMNHFRDGANFFWGISISPGSILGRER